VSHGIEFRLLGTVEVVAGDRVVEIGSPKQRTLLAALLLRLNIVVPADVLADELWGEAPPPSVQATLQSLVSRLRRALETTDPADGDTPRLRSKEGGYVLEAAADRVDTVRFDRLVAEGRRALAAGDAPMAAERLEAALALWRGPALGDLADPPLPGWRHTGWRKPVSPRSKTSPKRYWLWGAPRTPWPGWKPTSLNTRSENDRGAR
jgi:DNA-binding SARP family transcriptional activator